MSQEHIVVREPTDVMLVRVADELPDIQRSVRPVGYFATVADMSSRRPRLHRQQIARPSQTGDPY